MLEDMIAEALERAGIQWKSGDKMIQPTAADVRQVLDAAASRLYSEDVGTRLETGGIVVDKTATGFDVFVYSGFFS